MVSVAVFCALLVSRSPAPKTPPPDPLIERAKEQVRLVLKDPDSAQFRDLRKITNSAGETVVCGLVNARNSYGGYVGFKDFGVGPDGKYVGERDLTELVRMGCDGPVAEQKVRKQDAEAAVLRKLKEEADFSCNVIYTMMDNHFRNGESVEAVVDVAVRASLSRAQQNGRGVPPVQLPALRAGFMDALTKTAAMPAAVAGIKRGHPTYKTQTLIECQVQTLSALKAQAGIPLAVDYGR